MVHEDKIVAVGFNDLFSFILPVNGILRRIIDVNAHEIEVTFGWATGTREMVVITIPQSPVRILDYDAPIGMRSDRYAHLLILLLENLILGGNRFEWLETGGDRGNGYATVHLVRK